LFTILGSHVIKHALNKFKVYFVLIFSGILMAPVVAQENILTVYSEYNAPTGQQGESPALIAMTGIVKAILDKAGVVYNYEWGTPSRRALRSARNAQNTMIFPLMRRLDRESDFIWIAKMPLTPRDYLYKLKARPELSLTGLEEARDARIGVVGDDYFHEYFRNLEFGNIQVVNSSKQNILKLMLRRIDYVAQEISNMVPLCESVQVDCDLIEPAIKLEGVSLGLYVAMGKDTDPELVHAVSEAHAALVADGTFDAIFSESTSLMKLMPELAN